MHQTYGRQICNMTIVYFAALFPSQMSDTLSRSGVKVYQTTLLSEVFRLIRSKSIDVIVIDGNVQAYRATLLQKFITLQLKPETTTANVLRGLLRLKKKERVDHPIKRKRPIFAL